MAIKAPIPKVAALIPAPAKKPLVPVAVKAVDNPFTIGMMVVMIFMAGPIAATSPITTKIVFLVVSLLKSSF